MSDGIYSGFAWYYDDFMNDIPYDRWTENLCSLLSGYGINDGLVCELGCGTGEITMRLSEAGYDMIGIDISEEMLTVAREKQYDAADDPENNEQEAEKERQPILYLRQDMREFELFGTVRAVVSICDSMNYITEFTDLVEVFKKVNNYLDPDGIFIFDLKSDYFFRTEYADNSFSDIDEESGASLSWKNHYDAEKHLNTYTIDIKEIFEDEEGEEWEETHEEHIQRAYAVEEVKKALELAGLRFLKLLDADTMTEPVENTKRYYFVAGEGRQENKLYL